MYKLEDIKEIHLELTSKCQARCPMCPRRVNGGIINPLFEITEINLDSFKKWFNTDFILQLDRIFMCGNLGDPIIAEDCLGIVQYLKEINPHIQLQMNTNGSARNIHWWKELARYNVKVVFGIDGLADTHSLYRVDTDWNKIIKNATAFIEAGGIARWDMLAFKHNEHQIDDCKQMAYSLNFKEFSVKHTSRFSENKLHVLDDSGKTTHILYPTQHSLDMIPKVKSSINEIKPVIKCKAKTSKQFYVSANGVISPCCWFDFSWYVPRQDSRVDYMDTIGKFLNLNTQSLEEIFDSGYFQQIEDTWNIKPLLECSKQCGSFDKMGAQFVN